MHRVMRICALVITLSMVSDSVACGFKSVTPESIEANRSRELDLAKSTAAKAKFVFVGQATFVEATGTGATYRNAEFKLVELLVGRPAVTVRAQWREAESIPTCQESGWFNIPRVVAAGGTYIVYVAADGGLLRAAPLVERSEASLSYSEEKAALLGGGA